MNQQTARRQRAAVWTVVGAVLTVRALMSAQPALVAAGLLLAWHLAGRHVTAFFRPVPYL